MKVLAELLIISGGVYLAVIFVSIIAFFVTEYIKTFDDDTREKILIATYIGVGPLILFIGIILYYL